MARKFDDILDAASIRSLVRQFAQSAGAPGDPLDDVHAVHEHVRLFCGVLRVLAEDPYQPGHEMMALSLLQCAPSELSRMLDWEASDLASALVGERHQDGVSYGSVKEFLVRHEQIVPSVIAVVDGLDRMSRGESLSQWVEFAINVVRFADVLESYLRWQDDVLLPLARRVLDYDQLRGVTSALAQRPGFVTPEARVLSA